ncbi:hypothetical protein BpHYR1_006284 [Brachionus plicatilis]|uniref:Uncharacterized protein n=1 Tax=Brachionus plicatilis TaxID=10195 RepID=A0A3M7RAD5_BRAPC|nr:hypothetical protein BpHYR1_006284 [Brachionus plicatilis]
MIQQYLKMNSNREDYMENNDAIIKSNKFQQGFEMHRAGEISRNHYLENINVSHLYDVNEMKGFMTENCRKKNPQNIQYLYYRKNFGDWEELNDIIAILCIQTNAIRIFTESSFHLINKTIQERCKKLACPKSSTSKFSY